MNRREFVKLAGAGVPVGGAGRGGGVGAAGAGTRRSRASWRRRRRRRLKMKVGTQHGDSDAILRACAAFGVNNICSGLPSAKMDEAWSVEALSQLRERVASFGISLDMVPLPMSSSEISRAEMPAIYPGQEPGARPQHRRHLPDDPQLRARRHHAGEIQLHAHRHSAQRHRAGPRPVALQRVRLRPARSRIRR